MAREHFTQELKVIQEKVLYLSKLVDEQMTQAVNALYDQNLTDARRIIERDKQVDKLELEICDSVILLIATQQPVAKDLRKCITSLRIANDLERMGDHAKNVSHVTIGLGNDHKINLHSTLGKMMIKANEMLDLTIEAYKNEDIILAKKASSIDDEIDTYYELILKDIIKSSTFGEQQMHGMIQTAFCARYIERFADHITNIGENVLFLNKGENFQLN